MYRKIISAIMNKDFMNADKAFFEHCVFDFKSEKVFLDAKNFHLIPKSAVHKTTQFQAAESQATASIGSSQAIMSQATEATGSSQTIMSQATEATGTSQTNICFIDGGSCELIKSADLCLFFIRAVGVFFKDNKKTKIIKKEFHALISANKDSAYQFEIYGADTKLIKESFLIDMFDKTMMFGGKKVDISCICDLIRTLAEIELANEIADELASGDMIVLDGNLEADKTRKKESIDKLYAKAAAKKINVCAVAKTCNTLTNKGRSAITALIDMKPKEEMFYYHPVCKINKPNISAQPNHPIPSNQANQLFDVCFVKLNKDSEHMFRLDFFDFCDIKAITAALANNSNDFCFPGYPYGLIAADMFARVTNNEKGYSITALKTVAGKNWSIIKKHINTLNSHDILDSIS